MITLYPPQAGDNQGQPTAPKRTRRRHDAYCIVHKTTWRKTAYLDHLARLRPQLLDGLGPGVEPPRGDALHVPHVFVGVHVVVQAVHHAHVRPLAWALEGFCDFPVIHQQIKTKCGNKATIINDYTRVNHRGRHKTQREWARLIPSIRSTSLIRQTKFSRGESKIAPSLWSLHKRASKQVPCIALSGSGSCEPIPA